MPSRKVAENEPEAPLVADDEQPETGWDVAEVSSSSQQAEVERLSRVWREGPERVEPVFTAEQEAAREEGRRISEARRARG